MIEDNCSWRVDPRAENEVKSNLVYDNVSIRKSREQAMKGKCKRV